MTTFFAVDQKKAWIQIREEDPELVFLSPPCTARSRIRHISDYKRDPGVVAQEREQTRQHV